MNNFISSHTSQFYLHEYFIINSRGTAKFRWMGICNWHLSETVFLCYANSAAVNKIFKE